MGQYSVVASNGVKGFLVDGGLSTTQSCELSEITAADFSFDAVLTRESTTDRAWVTLNGYSREATWTGQVVSSEASASRVFDACAKCSTRVVETISVALLSRSQNDAVSGQCPPDALDGGLPSPDADAGITGPGQTPTGFDAVRLCGELVTVVVAEGQQDGGACDPLCGGCTVRYQLRGERR